MFKNDYTFSKKHLGLLMATGGTIGLLVILGIDVIDVGREGGIGPAQRLALELLAVLTLLGLTLIPLGDDSA